MNARDSAAMMGKLPPKPSRRAVRPASNVRVYEVSMRVVLINANVIDCVHPRPLAGASVTVEHGRIVEVRESSRSPDTHQAQVIDLHGAYLLPGLWDVHIHPDYESLQGRKPRWGNVCRCRALDL